MTPRAFRLLISSTLLIALLAPRAAVGQVVTREYQIKAGFLGLLADFVSWPGKQRPGVDVPLKIGIVGKDPFQITQGGQTVNYLDLKVAEKQLKGKRILVERFASAQDWKDCHIVFISPVSAANSNERTPEERLDAIRKRTAGQAVLLVGDVAGLAQRGSAVNLVVNRQTNRVQMEVNPQAAQRAALSIKPELLRFATIVREANNR